MEILGIGIQEIVFILIIALIVLGPREMQKTGRTLGRWLNQLVRSDFWKVFQKTSVELRNLPRNLMREANLEDLPEIHQDMSRKLQGVNEEVNKEIHEIRQTIDPRSAPAARKTPSPTYTSPSQAPLDQAEPPPEPPAANPTKPNDDPKQDD